MRILVGRAATLRSMRTLTIGVIPRSWRRNADGGQTVEIGNPSFSRTREFVISFSVSGIGTTVDSDAQVVGSMEALGQADSSSLSSLRRRLALKLGCQVSADLMASAIRIVASGVAERWGCGRNIEFVTEGGPEIALAAHHAGRVYVHFHDTDLDVDRVVLVDMLPASAGS